MTDLLDPPRTDERPRIDPRFARRWIDARREEGRRRLHIVVGLAVTGAVVVLAVGSLYTPLLHVRHLRISVNGPISGASISHLAGLSGRTLMIEVDPGRSVERLDSDPWLGAAHVSRSWPGTVSVTVTVRTPIAVVGHAGGWAEVDQTGRVLTDIVTPPPAMPWLQGVTGIPAPGGWLAGTAGPSVDPDAQPARLTDMTALADGPDVPSGPAAALAVLASLPADVRPDVISLGLTSPAGLSMVISPPRLAAGSITVGFGDGSELQSKVTALMTLLDQANLGGVTNLDLSVPSRPAAGLPAPSTTTTVATTTTTTSTVPAGPDSTPPTATTVPGSGGAGGLDGA